MALGPSQQSNYKLRLSEIIIPSQNFNEKVFIWIIFFISDVSAVQSMKWRVVGS